MSQKFSSFLLPSCFRFPCEGSDVKRFLLPNSPPLPLRNPHLILSRVSPLWRPLPPTFQGQLFSFPLLVPGIFGDVVGSWFNLLVSHGTSGPNPYKPSWLISVTCLTGICPPLNSAEAVFFVSALRADLFTTSEGNYSFLPTKEPSISEEVT